MAKRLLTQRTRRGSLYIHSIPAMFNLVLEGHDSATGQCGASQESVPASGLLHRLFC
jgi:hypothetical protein